MEELIYYPGFEVRDPDWLKFALLYIDRLSPIIPQSGDPYLSSLFEKVRGETDLIMPYRPNENDGRTATLDAIDVVERILRRPKLYSEMLGDPHFTENWKNPENQQYTLFREKFTEHWGRYCLKNRLGQQTIGGILVAKQLGLIYMSLLAHVISETESRSPITDYPEFNRISIVTRKPSFPVRKRISIAQGILRFKLPSDLRQISFDKIIKYRKRPGFKERLHSFHKELAKYIDDLEGGRATRAFFDSRGSIFAEFSDEIVKVGAGATTFALGIWLLLAKPAATPAYIKELSAGAVLSIGSIIGIRSTWKHTRTKRYTRKYLADLAGLR